ncbi:MAG: DUF362 domain-containing protein [Candidatus Bathyarchaeota archaeon]|nr:DUF362 domain-containing protein [Candidatus Bathyarchaeota archaeon]
MNLFFEPLILLTTKMLLLDMTKHSLKSLPIKVYVVESDASLTDADKAFVTTGMKAMCARHGVECLNLRHLRAKIKLKVPNGEVLSSITVPQIVTTSAIISAAKLKTHVNTKVTLGMKNLFGLLPDKFKAKYHALGISTVIVDVNTVIKPVLTVIDGFVGMEGKGPINGTPVKMDLVIAGKDVVATDAVASLVMGVDPYKVKHIYRAYEKGLGNLNFQVLGEQIDAVARTFKTDSK